MKSRFFSQKGFTILEILLIISAIFIFLSMIIMTIMPSGQLSETLKADKRTDINNIANAVLEYAKDHNGALPETIKYELTEICKADIKDCNGYVDLSILLKDNKYLDYLPVEDLTNSEKGIGYKIKKAVDDKIEVVSSDNSEKVIVKITK